MTDEQVPAEADLAKISLARARAAAKVTPSKKNAARSSRRSSTGGRDPQPVDAVLSQWITDQGVQHEVEAASLMALWPQIVGVDLADHVVPEGIRTTDAGRELRLRAESTAWATQVRLLLPQVLGRIREQLGAGAVDRISVAGPTPPRRPAGPRRVPGPGPRDTYG